MATRKLIQLLQPLIEDLGFEFVGLEYTGQSKNAVLRIYIDHERGIDLADCGEVSGDRKSVV